MAGDHGWQAGEVALTDIYVCPGCNERRGCNVKQHGPKKMQIWTMKCGNCGYKYVWTDQKAKNVIDAYREAVKWAYGKKNGDVL